MKILVCGSLLIVAFASYVCAVGPPEPYGVSSHVAGFNFGGRWKGKLDIEKDKDGSLKFKPEADKDNYFTGDWGYHSDFQPYPPKPKETKPKSQESSSERPKSGQNKPSSGYGRYPEPDYAEPYGYGANRGRPYIIN